MPPALRSALRIFCDSRGVTYQSFWVINMLVATADRALVEAIAARPDVARVDSNRPARWIEDPSIANFGVTPSVPSVRRVGRAECERSPSLGTGLHRPGHRYWQPGHRHALDAQCAQTTLSWLEWATADHNYNWHDSIHSGGGVLRRLTHLAPCDDHGHGTHTTGTTVRRRRRGQPDRSSSRREVDRLPQHGRGHRHPGHLHRVLPVLHRARLT